MNEKYKQDFIHAGKLAKETRAYGKSLIKKGASYNDAIVKINQKIAELGARPAFPPQIALNYVAAHYLPDPGDDIIFNDQVVKLDVGVCYNGAIGDCAVTIDLSGKYQRLIDATEAALLAAEQIIKVGLPFREIGKIIETTIESYGFSPVRNLSGHGLGYYQIHTAPSVPNYHDRSTAVVKAGMTFAIEPFATNGEGLIHESGHPTIFSLIKSKPPKSDLEKFLLSKMKSYEGLPFALHAFASDQFSWEEITDTFNDLQRNRSIVGYPPLIEDENCMVAQAENSVLVDKKGNVTITTR